MLLMNWIQNGRQKNIKSAKLRNDIVDLNFATFALYFDGILTNDQKLIDIYEHTKMWLNYFCRVAEAEPLQKDVETV